jgi:hypothetical protein
MKKKILSRFMKDPYFLTAMYCKMKNTFLEKGFDDQSSSLNTVLTMVPAFTGRTNLDIVEIDKNGRIIMAIVDAVLYSKN